MATTHTNVEKMWMHSPLKYADKCTTPTLFIHAEQDYRCWMVEALQMYTTLINNGVRTRLCLFHNENHELSRGGRPKGRIRRLSEITDWMDAFLKPCRQVMEGGYMLLIKGGYVKPITGEDIEDGEVLVDGGKIVAVGRGLDVPAGAEVFDASGSLVTPGLIDAHCHIGMHEEGIRWEGNDTNEYSSPVTPELRAIDGINPA